MPSGGGPPRGNGPGGRTPSGLNPGPGGLNPSGPGPLGLNTGPPETNIPKCVTMSVQCCYHTLEVYKSQVHCEEERMEEK
jgi:hypothetical protein